MQRRGEDCGERRIFRRGAATMSLERITLCDRTDFRLLQAELQGEDLTPVYEQRQAAGFNCARVFGTCAQMFRLVPSDYGAAYFDAISTVADRLSFYGSYLNLALFADAKLLGFSKQYELDLWGQVGWVAQQHGNILLSAGNELNKPENFLEAVS